MHEFVNGCPIHLSLPWIEHIKAIGTVYYHARISAVCIAPRELRRWNGSVRSRCGVCKCDGSGKIEIAGRGKHSVEKRLVKVAWENGGVWWDIKEAWVS